MSQRGSGVVADTDIARFFFGTIPGWIALLGGATLTAAITAFEVACLMAVAVAAWNGSRLTVRDGVRFVAQRAPAIVRLAGHMVLRLIIGLIPFVVAIGAVYLLLLRGHDINYFLSRRPAEFKIALALAALIVIALAWLLLRTIARWALALPMLIFEGVHPREALRESAARSAGNQALIVLVVALWATFAVAIGAVAALLIEVGTRARAAARRIAGCADRVPGDSGDRLACAHDCRRRDQHLTCRAPARKVVAARSARRRIISPDCSACGSRTDPPCSENENRRCIGRRPARGRRRASRVYLDTAQRTRSGCSASRITITAPENTLAAFRQAIADRADYVELDVQESSDGEVLVVHDSDLMKIAGSPMKIWEHTAAELRAIDIGSHRGPKYNAERVPTLAEALAVCKGRVRVLVELKSYGHEQDLERRVAAIVGGGHGEGNHFHVAQSRHGAAHEFGATALAGWGARRQSRRRSDIRRR